MAELIHLDTLHPEIRTILARYCGEMLELHQGNLRSIVVYGSAAGDHYLPGRSNINLMFIFQNLPFSTLKGSLKVISSGRKKRILAPLFLTEEYIISSSDAFPIEFLDIKENHVNLYGEDIFQRLQISQMNLRLQCEQEIKGKLIRLRQSYLETGLRKKHLEDLLSQSLNSLMPTFRCIMHLKGYLLSQPMSREEIISTLANDFQLREETLMAVLNIKRGKLRLDKSELEVVLSNFLNTLQKLAQSIDQLSIRT
jgi:hypothetical protein